MRDDLENLELGLDLGDLEVIDIEVVEKR